jgi:hypothetical protein
MRNLHLLPQNIHHVNQLDIIFCQQTQHLSRPLTQHLIPKPVTFSYIAYSLGPNNMMGVHSVWLLNGQEQDSLGIKALIDSHILTKNRHWCISNR